MKIKVIIEHDDGKCEESVLLDTNIVKEDSIRTYSQYARFFDESSPAWTKDANYNLVYLLQQQQYANDKLKAKGYLFLNEVYDMLGIPKTKEGQVVGWVYDKENPIGDNFVDFGIYNLHNDASRAFVNGYERNVLLDFNVDGMIIDRIS